MKSVFNPKPGIGLIISSDFFSEEENTESRMRQSDSLQNLFESDEESEDESDGFR